MRHQERNYESEFHKYFQNQDGSLLLYAQKLPDTKGNCFLAALGTDIPNRT
jgi:hypothetical protein